MSSILYDPNTNQRIADISDYIKSARPDFSAESHFVTVGFNHYFSGDWQLSAQYFWHDEDRLGVRMSAENLVGNGVLFDQDEFDPEIETYLYYFTNRVAMPRFVYSGAPDYISGVGEVRGIYDEQEFETNNNAKIKLDGTFEQNAWTHHLTLGAEWYQQDIYKDYTIEKRNLFSGMTWTKSEFDANFLNMGFIILDPDRSLGFLDHKKVRLLYNDYAVFLQDVVELNEKWVVTLGGRYSYLDGEHTNVDEWVVTSLDIYDRFSAQAGVVYKITENHSLYANYSEAMRANYHLDEVRAERSSPELSDQVEIGIKSLLNNGRLLTSLGLFEINKNNVDQSLIILFGQPGQENQFSTWITNQTIRGLDLDLTMQLSPEFDVLAGVSVIDPEISSGVNQGNTPVLVAGQSFSLFGHYELPANLEISGGVNYVGSRYMDNANRFEVDPYMTFDLSMGQRILFANQEVKWQLSVTNLTDEEYSVAMMQGNAPILAEGRAIMSSIKVDW